MRPFSPLSRSRGVRIRDPARPVDDERVAVLALAQCESDRPAPRSCVAREGRRVDVPPVEVARDGDTPRIRAHRTSGARVAAYRAAWTRPCRRSRPKRRPARRRAELGATIESVEMPPIPAASERPTMRASARAMPRVGAPANGVPFGGGSPHALHHAASRPLVATERHVGIQRPRDAALEPVRHSAPPEAARAAARMRAGPAS